MPASPESADPPGLRPPRFRLTTLLVAVALLCGLLAAARFVGPYGTFALVLLLLAVIAHVAGNALGTQLRDSAGRRARLPDETEANDTPRQRSTGPQDFAPPSRLVLRESLGKPIVLLSVAGALLAALGGWFLLGRVLGDKATLANLSFGGFAFGVLGAIWTFIGGSFLQVLGNAWWHAARDSRKSDPR